MIKNIDAVINIWWYFLFCLVFQVMVVAFPLSLLFLADKYFSINQVLVKILGDIIGVFMLFAAISGSVMAITFCTWCIGNRKAAGVPFSEIVHDAFKYGVDYYHYYNQDTPVYKVQNQGKYQEAKNNKPGLNIIFFHIYSFGQRFAISLPKTAFVCFSFFVFYFLRSLFILSQIGG